MDMRLRRGAAVALLLALALVVATASAASGGGPAGDVQLSVRVGSLERRAVAHVPAGFDGVRPVPLLIMFHGGGGTAAAVMQETGWSRTADAKGFLVVYPEGLPRDPTKPGNFRRNPQTWNDGSGRFNTHVDDVAFVRALLDVLGSRYPVDPARIFLCGFSNGASMAFRAGIELSERVAAVAPVAGALWVSGSLARPVSLLYLTGAADPLNPLAGGVPRTKFGWAMGGRTEKPPARKNVQTWARLLGCDLARRTLEERSDVTMVRYAAPTGAVAEFWTIAGAGHTWPGGTSLLPAWMVGPTSDAVKANEVIWDFFERHPRLGPEPPRR